MATTALGPTMAGGTQPIVKDGYELTYFPDVNNDALQNEGKPPVFYWLPNYVHIARKDGRENGDLQFCMIRFAGKQTTEGNIGVDPQHDGREVAGGVLAVTVTSAPPDHVLIESQNEIIGRFQGKQDYFWGIRSNVKPLFRPAPIVSNNTCISNLSPGSDGSVVEPVNPAPAGGGNGAPPVIGNTPPVKKIEYRRVAVPTMISQRGFSTRNFGGKKDFQGNLEPWYFNMQGQGNGSVDPMGHNAFTGLMGVYPASILYQAFKMAYTPVRVCQNYKVKFWSPVVELTIRGNWQRIFDHFSAAASGHYLWFSADIKAEFNNLRISGGIEVDIKVDPTIPGAEKMQQDIEKRTDLIQEKFMELAKNVIFQPAPTVPPAEAPSSGGLFGLWGAGVALKYRHDSTNVNLYYHEKRQLAYLQDWTISDNLEGVYEEIKQDPEAEKKYFLTVYMDEWPRKLGRIFKPVVNWPQPALNWAGEPVAFLSVQVGYPNTQGEINWVGHTFDSNDSPTTTWKVEQTQKQASDVRNAPAGWTPDKTFIKRRVHMLEPPDPIANPFVRIQIEDNEIDIDPGPNGSMVNDITLEVRADDACRIRQSPIGLNVELENTKQLVEVTFQATDENWNPITKFPPQKFIWNFADQETGRHWSIYTSDEKITSFYMYQVRVIVKGGLFTKGVEWTGPWVRNIANGPLTVSVPSMDDEGVTVKKTFEYKREDTAVVTPPPTKEIQPTYKEIDYNYLDPGANVPPSSRTPLSRKMTLVVAGNDDNWKEV